MKKFLLLTACLALAACGSARDYRTVQVSTPGGIYTEQVGITPPTPTHNPDGTPYVPPTIVHRPMTVYSPNAGPVTVSVDEEQPPAKP